MVRFGSILVTLEGLIQSNGRIEATMVRFRSILPTLALPWPEKRTAPNRAAQHEEDTAEARSSAYVDLELSGQVIKWTAADERGIQAMKEARERISGRREGKRIKGWH